jgi:transcription-repair coupling factor (superfamily II helicase)
MDRLVCGDVGFGKTEVAIRAAFKAVMGGRQVAMLVPTTVLAQQHFNTFRERVADYPVRVELLSRFRTRREQQRVIQDLATGAVDIVSGTHRLLQEDIAFKELGLVVIDEEQRFGVMHKEKLKLLRRLVDVLTLTATPIPRTLYQALVGARDMSTIETPPVDRLPVETIVCGYDERVIRDAIQREMNRGGQVFFLHNRVQTIDAMAVKLRALVPKARLVVGHGQMKSDELEEVMTRFVNGEADVLLSTTIIESGLDIPNANTILIDRADRFGLSELYQLRGRVGRYKHQAYAYLLIPRHARLLTDARKRISALKQYSTLGSGFKIAMRDLEIRGAGNLLGPEQSGHITAVGFDLYCKLLQHSVASLKGEKVKPREEVALRLDFVRLNVEEVPVASEKTSDAKRRAKREEELTISVPRETAVYVSTDSHDSGDKSKPIKPIERATACLPSSYIAEPSQRIQAYRKLAELLDEEGVGRWKAELRDRFGPLPASVELLLQLAVLKLAAGERGLRSVETREDRLMFQRGDDFITLDGKFPRLTKRTARARVQEILRLIRALPSPTGK